MENTRLRTSETNKIKLAMELLSDTIKGSKFENYAFYAGGLVRDRLMGRTSNDIDICVNLDNGGIELATYITDKLDIGSKSNPVIFERFGTANIRFRGIIYRGVDLSDVEAEFVMTRKEEYVKNSRNPSVERGSIFEDVIRRDFTINSLLENVATGEIIDLVDGESDITAGIIRTYNNPNDIFEQDPLRMLRAIRFMSQLEFDLPLSMIRAIKNNRDKLTNISKERISSEFVKMLYTNKAGQAFRLLEICGLLEYMGMLSFKTAHPDNIVERLNMALPNISVRLTILFRKYNIEELTNTLKFMRFSTADSNRIITLHSLSSVKYVDFGETEYRCYKIKYLNYIDDWVSLVESRSRYKDQENWHSQNLRKGFDSITQTRVELPINGFDIMNRFDLTSGSNVGGIMRSLESHYYSNPDITAEECYDIAEHYLDT